MACESCSRECYKPQSTDCTACVTVMKAKVEALEVPKEDPLEVAKARTLKVAAEARTTLSDGFDVKSSSRTRGHRTVLVNDMIFPSGDGVRGALIRRWMRRNGFVDLS
jgi:hypothetical protein